MEGKKEPFNGTTKVFGFVTNEITYYTMYIIFPLIYNVLPRDGYL